MRVAPELRGGAPRYAGCGAFPQPPWRGQPGRVSRSVRLRPWQHAALTQFSRGSRADFLAVATPGAGKTTFALVAARLALARRPSRVIVVTPTSHLKQQWAEAAARFQLHLDPAWTASTGGGAADTHGAVTTYQQVATNPAAMRRLATDAFVILDEVHHGGEERVWGAALQQAFATSHQRLALSGTPFRSDTQAIPFVRYDDEEAVPDFEYGYSDALADGGVVRPVYFPAFGGEMEWSAPNGSVVSASFDDPLNLALSNQRLRTALSLEGDWLPTVLREAVERLRTLRKRQPNAGGLVIATDLEHARAVTDLLVWRLRATASVVTSDDPTASDRITSFARDTTEWLVAVRMVSEGVDIPRLRVGVYATPTTTDLFFRQAVGRLVRWTTGERDQRAWMYIPDDARLRAWAAQIATQRRHSLQRRRTPDGDAPARAFEPTASQDGDATQLSFFAPLSAVTTHVAPVTPWDEPIPAGWPPGEHHVEVELAPPPPLVALTAEPKEGQTLRQAKDELRAANATAARDLARKTGQSHSIVNAELNRLAGVRRITEATVVQLEQRLRCAERWLARL
jgi:superfamily II DNA or RNA helicase